MNHADYVLALSYLYGGGWFLRGEDFDDLEWYRDDKRPTREAVEAALPEARYHRERALVEQNRRGMYAEICDPLYFKWQRGEATQQEYLDAVQRIKNLNPYPEAP